MKKTEKEAREILIAEDSKTQAEQLRYLLEEKGYKVTAAANGKIALDLARQHKPALIVSDVMMPELNGYGLCKAIKEDEELKDIPIILVTTLTDSQEVVSSLECGADHFIRKPYDESQLLSSVEYLLMNINLRKHQKTQMGMEITLNGRKHFITAERQQILDLLISTYEQAVHINQDLQMREKELAHSNQVLVGLFHIAESLNQATSEQQVVDRVLEKVMELPGVQTGWICMREEGSDLRVVPGQNLPPALEVPGILEKDCECRRKILDDELETADNVIGCERLAEARTSRGDLRGLDFHASVPLRLGDHVVGVMNLAGPDKGLFDEDALKVLQGVGNQVAVALERARLHEHMEKLVHERTAKLTAEIAEKKRVQKEQARLAAIIEATPDFVATADLDGHPIYINQGGMKMLGLEPGQSATPPSTIYETHPEWAARLVRDEGVPHAIKHGSWSGETALLRQDGSEIPVLQVIIAHRGKHVAAEYLSTIVRDISKQREQADRIVRLNRVYAVLSGINTTIVRIHDRQELFDEACRIAIEQGQFRMAWIGLFDTEAEQVTPVAWAGNEKGYLDMVNLSTGEGAPDASPLLICALREKKICVSNDIEHDPQKMRWREELLLRGYLSVAVLPLLLNDEVVGAFTLYSSEKNFFDSGEMALIAEIAGDISFALDHLEKEKQLNYLAYYDELTDLPNRSLFIDRLTQFLNTAKEDDEAVAALVLDLDRFRFINETYGRAAGDDLLRQSVDRLVAAGLDKYHVARISSDVFAIALDRIENASDVAFLLEQQILRQFSRPFTIAGNELLVSVKTGIAMFPDDGMDADTLFRNAEAALKNAKLSGDRYLFYTPEINARVAENLTLENKLRRALEREQFVLYYQPKVDLKSGRIAGLEALIRWNDPDTGLVPPFKFIPLLEETGMILDVGRWALERAVEDVRLWLADNLQPPRVAVNVSQVQLRQKDFVAVVEGVLQGSENASKYLDLEITESLIMHNIEENIQKLNLVRDMGVEVAIDDFGTGYSSLSYIAKLPVNSLKIDRAFIISMTDSPDDLSIVSTIISLAHTLNMTVVAEGVETKAQADLLRLLKCDVIQGYLFSPAVPADQIGAFLREKKSLEN